MTGTASFVGSFSSEYAVGVASLDPPHLQQTKSEIRALASEIASLSSASLESEEFFEGFLPRLCTAMGAESAAVWQTESSFCQSHPSLPDEVSTRACKTNTETCAFRLIAERNLPSALCSNIESHDSVRRPSLEHLQILQCVVAEGSPILVPPGATRSQSNRPVNPLSDSLIVVPVRIQDDIEYLLEVVQRPSGGPAAQRGYLRFVAQMADLMNDYLRRDSLRQHIRRSTQLKRFEKWLAAIAQEPRQQRQHQHLVDAIADLMNVQLVFLLAGRHQAKVTHASGVAPLDPRSDTILTLQQLERKLARNVANAAKLKRCWNLANEFGSDDTFNQLCDQVACPTIVRVPLGNSNSFSIYIAAAESLQTTFEECGIYANSLIGVCGSRGMHGGATSLSSKWSSILRGDGSPSSQRMKRLIATVLLMGIGSAVAAIPVPQQISASAVLTPVQKQVYYAPTSAIIDEVLVNDEQWVQANQPLLTLSDRKLEHEQERIAGEMVANQARKSHLNAQLLRDPQLSTIKRDELESELDQLQIATTNLAEQKRILDQQTSDLMIVAKSPGKISSWDLRNRLMNRPVSPGDILLTTYEPDGSWQLQVAIPEHRAGLISEAMQKVPGKELPIRFVLTSHPNRIQSGMLSALSPQAISQPGGNNVILANARLSSDQLPMKKDGAIARVTVDCGYVSAIWLLTRDAYWAIESRLKMLW
jgi:hypothetical protein